MNCRVYFSTDGPGSVDLSLIPDQWLTHVGRVFLLIVPALLVPFPYFHLSPAVLVYRGSRARESGPHFDEGGNVYRVRKGSLLIFEH